MLRKGRHHKIAGTNFVEVQPLKAFQNPGTDSHDALGAASPQWYPRVQHQARRIFRLFMTDSTWPQIADMMIPLHPTMTNGKTESPVTWLANDGLLRPNIDRISIQPSLPTMPIGHFHELALP